MIDGLRPRAATVILGGEAACLLDVAQLGEALSRDAFAVAQRIAALTADPRAGPCRVAASGRRQA
jgi:hypothetical protein